MLLSCREKNFIYPGSSSFRLSICLYKCTTRTSFQFLSIYPIAYNLLGFAHNGDKARFERALH